MIGRLSAALPGDQVTRWEQDAFALGSVSYPAVGTTGAHYDALAAPLHARVFFAGEHTHRQAAATVAGAYASGIRAATEVAEALGLCSVPTKLSDAIDEAAAHLHIDEDGDLVAAHMQPMAAAGNAPGSGVGNGAADAESDAEELREGAGSAVSPRNDFPGD